MMSIIAHLLQCYALSRSSSPFHCFLITMFGLFRCGLLACCFLRRLPCRISGFEFAPTSFGQLQQSFAAIVRWFSLNPAVALEQRRTPGQSRTFNSELFG